MIRGGAYDERTIDRFGLTYRYLQAVTELMDLSWERVSPGELERHADSAALRTLAARICDGDGRRDPRAEGLLSFLGDLDPSDADDLAAVGRFLGAQDPSRLALLTAGTNVRYEVVVELADEFAALATTKR